MSAIGRRLRDLYPELQQFTMNSTPQSIGQAHLSDQPAASADGVFGNDKRLLAPVAVIGAVGTRATAYSLGKRLVSNSKTRCLHRAHRIPRAIRNND